MLRTTFYLSVLTGILLFLGHLLAGKAGVMVALGIAAITNLGSWFFSDRLALMGTGAEEVGAGHPLHGLVAQLAQRAGLPMPRVYVIPDMQPNAFATGRSPDNAVVAATQGLLEMLSWDEVAGVMAHELAHVQHRDIFISSVAATIAGAITSMAHWLPMLSGRNREEGPGMIESVVLAVLTPIAAMLVQMAVSRSREYEADRRGAEIVGNPLVLANALAKISGGVAQIESRTATAGNSHMYIVHPFAGGLASLLSTHPDTQERVNRLMAQARSMR